MDKVKLDENLSIGDETWLCISALEEEMDIKPFFSACQSFLFSYSSENAKRFPQIELNSPDSLHLVQEFTDFLICPD